MAISRKKQSATVNAQQLPGAVGAKIGLAGVAVNELRQMERPVFTGGFLGQHEKLTAFLEAARGVFLTIETFAKSRLQGDGFMTWVHTWEDCLLPGQLELWNLMTDQRDAHTHGAGPDLVDISIPLEGDYGQQHQSSAILLGLRGSLSSKASKSGVRFAAHADRPASDVCADYLLLVQQFHDDFKRDHAWLL